MNMFKFKNHHVTGLQKPKSEWNRGFGDILGLFGGIFKTIFIQFLKFERFCKVGFNIYNLASNIFVSDEIKNSGVFGPKIWTPISQWKMIIGGSNKDQRKDPEMFFPNMPKKNISLSAEKKVVTPLNIRHLQSSRSKFELFTIIFNNLWTNYYLIFVENSQIYCTKQVT